jgi:hypothetical protein
MKAYQLIQAISPALRQEILTYIQTETREAFRTAIQQVAAQRKFRPQFIQQKNREQQAAWLAENLRLKMFDGVCEQLFQLWLLKGKTPLLAAFLDAAGIKHEKGQVDDLPEELTDEQVNAGIDAMLKENTGEQIAVYLTLFQGQRPGGWKAVGDALEKREELKLAPPSA